ncbi:MAG TPA: anti-sigma factor antagonist [Thermoanaerobaculia bacterium]|nr:anti-sigma factor antagonist [Thermoanaerobaculia bacterium]
MDLGSRFENIELVQVVLKDTLDQLGVEADARDGIDLAVREAVANAIKHGNAQNPDKQVHIDLLLEDGELVIRIEDEGVGFDPSSVQDPLAPENLLRPNGRGILFMRKFMDDVQYSLRPGGGTVVTMRKRLAGPNLESKREERALMRVTTRTRGDVTIIDLNGKITIGSGDIALRNAVHQAVESGATKVLINLHEVTTIDSSGVGELVSAYTTATNRGVRLKLVNLPDKVADILTVTQLITVFDVYDSEDEAITAFQ